MGGSEESGPGQLTLEEAIARATESSHLLAAAEAGVGAAEAGRAEAGAARLPRLELSEEFQRTTNPVYVFGNLLRQESFAEENFELDRLNSPDALDNFGTRVDVFQPVWTGGRITGGIEAADGALEAAEAMRERTRQEVVFATIEAYSGAVVSRHQLEEAVAARDAVIANLKLVRDRFETGLVVESDLLQLQVRESELEEAVIRAENALAVWNAELNLAIGAEPMTEWRLAELDPDTLALELGELAMLLSSAISARPDLQAAAARVMSAEGRTRAERSGLFPQIGVSGSWEANAESGIGDDGTNWSLFAGIRWTAFDGFATRSRARRAGFEAEAARAMHDQLAERISLQVRRSYLDLKAAAERRTQAERASTLGERNLEIVRDRYREGLATLVELQESESASTRARARSVAALRDLLVARAGLELAVGRL
jgi:outer membrane protein TolC